MTPGLDVYRSANLLVKQHGTETPIHAAMQADAMLDKGDPDGQAVWLRIVKAVDELLETQPGGWSGRPYTEAHRKPVGARSVAIWASGGVSGSLGGLDSRLWPSDAPVPILGSGSAPTSPLKRGGDVRRLGPLPDRRSLLLSGRPELNLVRVGSGQVLPHPSAKPTIAATTPTITRTP